MSTAISYQISSFWKRRRRKKSMFSGRKNLCSLTGTTSSKTTTEKYQKLVPMFLYLNPSPYFQIKRSHTPIRVVAISVIGVNTKSIDPKPHLEVGIFCKYPVRCHAFPSAFAWRDCKSSVWNHGEYLLTIRNLSKSCFLPVCIHHSCFVDAQ